MSAHPTAVIDPAAELADDAEIGPYAVLQGPVRLGSGCKIGPHATIMGKTTMGRNCRVHALAVIGNLPQDLKYRGEDSSLVIGEENVFREYVTVNSGTAMGGGETTIGNGNLFMAYVHVAHDCIICDNIVLANVATLGGHIRIEDGARVSGLAAVHHFVTVGKLAFVGGCAKVVQDVPPYMMADGNPAKVRGVNVEGLRRSEVPRETIYALKEAYRLLYRSELNRAQALDAIGASEHAETAEVGYLLRFFEETERGRQGRARERVRMEFEARRAAEGG